MFKGRSKYFLFVTIIVLLFCVVQAGAFCKSHFEEIKSKGVIITAITNEKPCSYIDDEGKLTGYAIDIARGIFNRLGIEKIDFRIVEMGSIIPGLMAGHFDVVTVSMWISPERLERVIFSDPHDVSGNALVVKRGNPHDLHSEQDIIDKGLKAAASPGSLTYNTIVKLGMPISRMVSTTDQASGCAAVLSDRADVWISTTVNAPIAVKNYPDLEQALPFEPAIIDGKIMLGAGAITFRKEDTDFRDACDIALAEMRDSGELFMILMKWDMEKTLANHKVDGVWKWLTWEDFAK